MKFLYLLISFLFSLSVFSTEIINLTPENTVVLRGTIDKTSIAVASSKLLYLSSILKSTERIYLVIESHGGDIDSGLDFINVMLSIPQKVDSIVFEA